jgi:hypothetical protein
MSRFSVNSLLEFRLSTSLIETFINFKVKETLGAPNLFALFRFFPQTNAVLSIQNAKNLKSGT